MDEKILSCYTNAEINNLKKNQKQNEFIQEKEEVFFSICNKMLDFLYNEIDKKEEPDSTLASLTKKYEMIRKKIHNKASLSMEEIAMLLNATQYVASDMKRLSKSYSYTSQTLENYIKTLISDED